MTAANLFAPSPFIHFNLFQDSDKKSKMLNPWFPRVLNVFLSFKFCLGQWGVQWVGMPLLCNRWPSIRFHPAIHLSFRKWQLKGREIKQRKILLDTILQHQPLWPRMTQWGSNGSYDQMWPRWHRKLKSINLENIFLARLYVLKVWFQLSIFYILTTISPCRLYSMAFPDEFNLWFRGIIFPKIKYRAMLPLSMSELAAGCQSLFQTIDGGQWAGSLYPQTFNISSNFHMSVRRYSLSSHF